MKQIFIFIFGMLLFGCNQNSTSHTTDSNQTSSIIRVTLEDNNGTHLLREFHISQTQTTQKNYLNKINKIIQKLTTNRSGILHLETIMQINNMITRENDNLKFEIISLIENGVENGLQTTNIYGRNVRKRIMHDGVFDGYDRIYWLPTSRISSCGQWKKGYQYGTWRAYYINGRMGLKWHMSHGKITGRAIAWSADGKKFSDGVYRKNLPYGGSFIEEFNTFWRRVLVQNPSRVHISKDDLKLAIFENGMKTSESH